MEKSEALIAALSIALADAGVGRLGDHIENLQKALAIKAVIWQRRI